jgi:hypothetical protein
MAERRYKSANIATQTDTFGAWVDRTNQLVFDLSEIIVTAQQNTTGGATSGNVVITSNVYNEDTQAWINSTGGVFQSNTVAVFNHLRGGNVQVANTLYVTSNSDLSNGTIAIQSNATVNSVTVKGSFVDLQTTNTFVNGSLLQVKSDVHINSTSTNTSINSTATHIDGNLLDINSTNIDMDGTTVDMLYDGVTITANDQSFKSNSTITVIDINGDGTSSSVTLSGNLVTVDSDESQFNANVTFGSANDDTVSFVSEVDTGINPVSNALALGLSDARWHLKANTIDASSTLNVAGQTDLNGDINLGNANSDTLSVVAEIDTSVVPTANAKALGLTDARWDLLAEDVNASNTLTVSGNSSLVGNTTVTGKIVGSNTIAITGAATLSNTLTVTGKSTLSTVNVSSTVQVNGAADFNNTADFAGNVNFQDSITVADNSTFTKTLAAGNTTVTGFVNVSGNIKGASANVSGHSNLTTLGVTGAVDLDDTLNVDGATNLGVANTSGLLGAEGGLVVTGQANVSSKLKVGNVVATPARLTVGNGTTNAIIYSNGSIDSDGSFTGVGGTFSGGIGVTLASTFANTLGVTGKATFASNVDISQSINITKIAAVTGNTSIGGKLDVTGVTTLADDLDVANNKEANVYNLKVRNAITSALVQTGATANIVSGQLYVNATGFTVTPNSTFQDDVTVVGDLTVQGSTSLATDQVLALNVSTMNSLDVSANATLDGLVTIGDGSGTESLTVYSPVGNSTVGFLPAVGNNVPFGSTTQRWHNAFFTNINASGALDVDNTADFEGNVNFQDSITVADNSTFSKTLASGNTTVTGFINVSSTSQLDGLVTVGGGVKPTSNSAGTALGSGTQRFVLSANTGNFSGNITASANIIAGNTAIKQKTITVGDASTNIVITDAGNIDMDGTLDVLKATALANTLAVTGAATMSGTANVIGDLSVHSDLKDEGGNAFRVYYANGDVAWPAP